MHPLRISINQLAFFAFVIGTLLSPFALTGQTEKILSFHADLQLSAKNELTVTETIKVYAAGVDIKRGIYRILPVNASRSNPNKRVKYEIISVTQDGQTADYHTEKSGDEFTIYIGSEDVLIATGEHTYVITYKTADNVGFFDKYDELYWNVTGNNWVFPIDSASAVIHLPDAARILQNSCYTGVYGSKESNCQSTRISPTEMSWDALNLSPGSGLTIGVGFSKQVITPPPPPGYWKKNGLLIFSILIMLILLMYYYYSWNKFGRDPEAPSIYPQFETPEGLSPAALGYINNESISNNFISASIINISVKGYIRIRQEEDNMLFGLIKNSQYVLVKTKDADASLKPEELQLMRYLFGSSNTNVLDGKYDPMMKTMVDEYKNSLKSQYESFVTKGNNFKFVLIPLLILSISLIIVGVYDSYNVDREIPMIVASIAGIFEFFSISLLIGYYMANFKVLRWIVIIGVILVFYAVYQYYLHHSETYLINNVYAEIILLVFGAISMIYYLYLIRQPSTEKLRMQSLIKGFDMYLGAAEEEQIKFFNPPKLTPEIFEKYLPYAIVLGTEKIWGKKFQNMLEASSLEPSQYHSSWYTGNMISPALFTSSLNSSFTQAISSASSPPSSSGSGGGGFSGGGGGGGGGGGW